MLVTEARPAPQFVRLPVGVIDAALALGKGHTETLLRLARFLWGGRVLEGSSGDWCAVLGIEQRTWQRHVPDLGRSGCLRYSQPQAGVYVVYGFPDDAAAYQAAWEHISTEAAKQNGSGPKAYQLPGLVEAFFVSGGATKLSGAVVVSSSVFLSDKKIKEQESKQQQSYSEERDGATILSGDGATVLSGRQLRSYEALRAVGMWATVAETLAQQYPWPMIDTAIKAARGGRNVAGLVRLALEQIPQAEIDAAWEAEASSNAQDEHEVARRQRDERTGDERFWDTALTELQLVMPRATFDQWLRDSRGLGVDDDSRFNVAVSCEAARDWCQDRLQNTIKRTVARLTDYVITDVQFVVMV